MGYILLGNNFKDCVKRLGLIRKIGGTVQYGRKCLNQEYQLNFLRGLVQIKIYSDILS